MAARLAEVTFQPDGDMPGEFSAVSADRINEALNFSARLIGLAEWGDDASFAHALLASHYLKRLGLGSNPATIEPTFSRTVGPVSHGPNPASFQGKNLQVTEYGRMYAMLCESRGGALGLTMV